MLVCAIFLVSNMEFWDCLPETYNIFTVVHLLVECAVGYVGGMCSLSYGWNVQSAIWNLGIVI